MQGLAQVPGDPPAQAPRPSRPRERSEGPQETPWLRASLRGTTQCSALPTGTLRSRPAWRGYDEDGSEAGLRVEEDGTWGGGKGPQLHRSAHPRVRRDIPPARAAPRSPARRLSPEREPGRGQVAGCSGRSGARTHARRLQRVRRSRRRAQKLLPPPARAEALSYLPPSASAPPGPGAQAGGPGRGLAGAGPLGGGAGGPAVSSPKAPKPRAGRTAPGQGLRSCVSDPAAKGLRPGSG